MKKHGISIVIPIFNEAAAVRDGVSELVAGLDQYSDLEYEIIFIENGSTDQTFKRLEEAQQRYRHITIHRLPKPDYGIAFLYGVREAACEDVFVFQIDCFPFEFLDQCLLNSEQAVLILGSRNPRVKKDTRPLIRRFLTAGLNLTLRVLFRSPFTDTHGVKYLHMPTIRKIVDQCRLDGGILETELVFRVNYAGLMISENPIPIDTYTPPKRSYLYKISRNIYLIYRLFKVFRKENLIGRRMK